MKTLSTSKNFLALEKEYSAYENSEIVIVSAPYEKTVSYGKGTGNGPKEIIKASQYVEFYDEEMDREVCFEKGIATLPQLKLKDDSPKTALNKINNEVTAHLNNNKFVVTLGGEHSISFAAIKAHLEKYSNLSILQFDAHSDLRESYQGSKYSHASVMARVAELTTSITQVGIRAQCKEEAEFIIDNSINTFYARDIRIGLHGDGWEQKIVETLNENVYITFDVDGLDPSVISATGTPEPGGLFWDETLDILRLVGKQRKVVGFDVVELAPTKDDVSSSFNVAKLIYKMLNYFV